jgi:hypothetical protein
MPLQMVLKESRVFRADIFLNERVQEELLENVLRK